MDIQALEKTLKVKFNNPDLLMTAVTHRSYLNENRAFHLPHNERLEFLGDAVLELISTRYLYENYPHPEGELTNFRSALVNYRMLSEIARKLNVEEYLLMSKGEAKDTGRARQVILANALEAIIGAIYLDLGYEAAKEFVLRDIVVELPSIINEGSYMDPKSKLQEIVQEKQGITPSYQVISEQGPDHDKVFLVGVFIGNTRVGEGKGPSKQEAEVAAAENALKENRF
ncbi:MAG: putative ribonuclease III [Candidatus Doudnabacteria bacterium Gr01-1014_77]|jgi:ribonuclease-3|uniref:Ribonuclease 3 n=1 Tax=Candidatus Doudnabacteria bacterium Gr01-1014_77 TaxID=2017133 RepID=A0A554JBH2_9BACT|nr:MAG: putative ribonuclease III [Candidatus Doudnabacteria bacterium Gr01-1014_77]